jgi:hypothetical protein
MVRVYPALKSKGGGGTLDDPGRRTSGLKNWLRKNVYREGIQETLAEMADIPG